ncbi:MAG: EpsG family protein, partial [Lachnospiraceae bacterium]|nr:EpsG family protein [Lachnospiraceae bacterium]
MIIPLSYWGSILLYMTVFLFSAYISKINIKNKLLQISLISFLPFLIAGLRYNVGWDYGSYASGFDLFNTDTSILGMLKSYEMGDSIGLSIILKLTKSMNSKFLFFAITSALNFVPAVLYLINEWDDEKGILQLSIFATGFSLYFTGLSAIKQGIAISFCLYSLIYVYKRKPIKFLLFVSIAFLFHASALAFFPVYFLGFYDKKIAGWKKMAAICGTFIVIFNLERILNVIGGTRFEDYGTSVVSTDNYSFFLMFFWLLIFLYFRKLLVDLDSRNDLFIILYAMSLVLMLLGFRNAFVKRIADYFSVVEIVLIPQLMFVFNKRSRTCAAILIGLYFILVCMKLNSGTV